MTFEEILHQWERKKKKTPPRGLQGSRPSPMEEWLDQYPPHKEEEDGRVVKKRVSRRKILSMPVQDSLDLHGLRKKDVEEELHLFLTSAHRRGFKKVLIIHGKGLHSKGGVSVLTPVVEELLRESSVVLDFGRGKSQDGGSGATWVALKN